MLVGRCVPAVTSDRLRSGIQCHNCHLLPPHSSHSHNLTHSQSQERDRLNSPTTVRVAAGDSTVAPVLGTVATQTYDPASSSVTAVMVRILWACEKEAWPGAGLNGDPSFVQLISATGLCVSENVCE